MADLLAKAKELSQSAAFSERKLTDGFMLWDEPLANAQEAKTLRDACAAIKDEFSNYRREVQYARQAQQLQAHRWDEIDELEEQLDRAFIVS